MRHWLLPGIAVAVIALVLALFTRAAAAQTERGNALIEQTLATKPDKHQGEMLCREVCSSCHGAKAYGSADPVTPSLAWQLRLYLIKQLVDFAEEDRTEIADYVAIARGAVERLGNDRPWHAIS